MQKDEALQLLNLKDNATSEEIVAKYNEQYSDYQVRLTNAPTPNLKKLYQKNLQELEEAKSVLISGTDTDTSELVSKTPVYGSKPQTTTRNRPPVNSAPEKTRKDTKKEPEGSRKNILVLALIIVLIVGISGSYFLYTMYDGGQKEIASLKVDKNKLIEENQNLSNLVAELEGLKKAYNDITTNHKIKIANKGTGAITIVSLVAVFKNDEGKWEKYECLGRSLNAGGIIKPGSSYSPEVVRGAEVIWNGSAIFYSLKLESGSKKIQQAGFYNDDASEGVINLKF
ncbi:MAG: hypothetical protein K9H16_04360 [Bacteroidales bacterium]|nr:hypothetical protein [Bacteroidales bacterium]